MPSLPMLSTAIFLSTAMALALSAMSSATPSLTQDRSGAEHPEEVVDRVVGDSQIEEDGSVSASTGRAEPTENWFGCSPDEDAPSNEACDEQTRAPSAAAE